VVDPFLIVPIAFLRDGVLIKLTGMPCAMMTSPPPRSLDGSKIFNFCCNIEEGTIGEIVISTLTFA